MSSPSLEEKRAKIKYWLEITETSRQAFAEKLGVHISSLNGWLSNKSIPEKRWQEIKAFFGQEEPQEAEQPQLVDLSAIRPVTMLYPEDKLDKLRNIAEKRGYKSVAALLQAVSDMLLEDK